MPQYIDVFLDDEERYYTNKGLRKIIEYIGRQEHKDKSSLSSDKAYSLGKKSINSRLKKWHKKAIDRLVRAEKYEFKYNYDQVSGKPVWKIHKNKAKKYSKLYINS